MLESSEEAFEGLCVLHSFKANSKSSRNKRCEPPRVKTNKMTVHPAKTQISLGIRPVWSESSLCAQWVAKGPSFLHADSEDSYQIGWMPRLIWVFAGRTCHFVGFVTKRLIFDAYTTGISAWLTGARTTKWVRSSVSILKLLEIV